MPEPHNADAYRKLVLENFDMSLGTGLNKLAGKAFRIGHLGYTNELTVLGRAGGCGDGAGAGRRAAREGGRCRGDVVSVGDGAARDRQSGLIASPGPLSPIEEGLDRNRPLTEAALMDAALMPDFGTFDGPE